MKLPRYTNTLVVRLVGFGVFLVLLGTVGRYFLLAGYIRENLIQATSAQQATLAVAAAQDINYKFTERLELLHRIAESLPVDLLKQPARLHAWLKQRAELQPLFSLGMMITDAAGTVITDFPVVPGRAGFSLASNPDFQHLFRGQSGIGAPRIGLLTHQPLIPMGVPVKDHTGNIRAMLIGVTALSSPNFLTFLQQDGNRAAEFRLVAPQARIMMDIDRPMVTLDPTPPKGINPLLDRAMDGFRGSGMTRNAQGNEEIAAIASIPSMGWFVIASVPTSEALAAVEKTKSYLLWHLFLLLGIGLPAIGGFVAWVLRPLYRAADKAERMARGEIPLQALPVVRDDEVGHLTIAFNQLLTKLVHSQEELEHMAYHDTLTGLPNRSLLVDRLEQALARANRHGTRLAVLFMDLDGFKVINDTLGHEAGDTVLRETARRLSSVVRQVDTLARIGGDEFVLLAVDLATDADQSANHIASKCINAVMAPLRIEGGECHFGISIGVALCCGGCTAERILAEADKAMYEAKQKGNGSYQLVSSCDDEPRAIETLSSFPG